MPTPAHWPRAVRWGALLLVSMLLAAALEALRLPAGLLLGPMIAAVALAAGGGAVPLARPVFIGAQGIVGVMIAASLPLSAFGEIAADWPVFLGGTLSTLIAASLLGWLTVRSGALPGTTAIWGSSPGAATAMTLMCEAYGADMRLVAFMQYLRVIACALVATGVARAIGTPAGTPPPAPTDWLSPPALWREAPLPLIIALGGAMLGVRLRLPGGALLLPMLAGLAAKFAGAGALALPLPILACGYAVIGWRIGLRFTPETVAHAARVFPRVLASILTLIAICAGFGALLSHFAGVDPLTAYLATSPGGADSVAIIAAATPADISFVMAMQVGRFLLVLATGPALARFLSRGHANDAA